MFYGLKTKNQIGMHMGSYPTGVTTLGISTFVAHGYILFTINILKFYFTFGRWNDFEDEHSEDF